MTNNLESERYQSTKNTKHGTEVLEVEGPFFRHSSCAVTLPIFRCRMYKIVFECHLSSVATVTIEREVLVLEIVDIETGEEDCAAITLKIVRVSVFY